MDHRFQENSQFVLLAVNNAYTDLPDAPFELSDGTWIMSGAPVTDDDLGTWEKWLGSIRMERLWRADLVLLVEEPSDTPGILGAAHRRLSDDLVLLFYMLHLGGGIATSEDEGADRLVGSSVNGVCEIRQASQIPTFYRSYGRARAPITRDWLEDSRVLRDAVAPIKDDKTQFRRVMRGLNTLFKGLKEKTSQDRLHQFVRSLEALILPDKGNTNKQFVYRCQTFARAGDDTHNLLLEAYAMRSDTEHLNPWDKSVMENYPPDEHEDVCFQRTRQIEHLACYAYSRFLSNPALREHFRTDDSIEAFWKLPDHERSELWGDPLDIAQEPQYNQWRKARM